MGSTRTPVTPLHVSSFVLKHTNISENSFNMLKVREFDDKVRKFDGFICKNNETAVVLGLRGPCGPHTVCLGLRCLIKNVLFCSLFYLEIIKVDDS